jgi:predicted metal-dependent peptidase
MKLTPEQRKTKARVRLMTHPLFCALSGIMMMGKVTITEEVETACTNGRDEEYNPKFMEQLNDEELCFLIAHENFHKMYQHCSIWEHLFREDAECAGIATDAVINLQIEKWGNPVGQFDRIVQFPSIGGVYDEAFEGMDTKQVYDIIRKNKKKQADLIEKEAMAMAVATKIGGIKPMNYVEPAVGAKRLKILNKALSKEMAVKIKLAIIK